MRISFFLIILLLGFTSCKQNKSENNADLAKLENIQDEYESFGERISASNSLSAREMQQKYQSLKPGDTIQAKFNTRVNAVCKMKGCWMELDLPETEEDPMIKFKDYGFFVPKDIEGREVIVEGLAFIEEISVEDRRHFAQDAGKNAEEIEAINEPEKSFGFLAHGVLLKK
ncbi:DUF4920 domain-containing protein [Gramella sp. KN1008]|uniref:DUF4920 domain-containing protein n=1 Tax=Gramella sp. KN1008 TaxID=2529298 RepID=UPI00103C4C80|nr:DUF4920 domain-containing protein [Gramella sp. KN1008]TBW26510.1 DUF4920 domain-containing protein [Gramella sp. KN1008]